MTPGRALPNPLSPVGRLLSRAMWWVEHAFERARASGKAEDDAGLRVFFVMGLFVLLFGSMAIAATRAAVFPRHGGNAAVDVGATPRSDIVDRNGQLLALDLVHYRLYVNAAEIASFKSEPSGITSRVYAPSSLSCFSVCSISARDPNVTRPIRSPALRLCSRSRINSRIACSAFGGSDRDRSATTRMSIPSPPRFHRGPVSASSNSASNVTRNTPVNPRAVPHRRYATISGIASKNNSGY